MKYRFVDKVEFAKFADEFNVAQHLDLCNSTLLLLVRGEWAIIFLKNYREGKNSQKRGTINAGHDQMYVW